MPKKKILVLTDTMPWGHRSIAKAIYGHFKLRESELNLKVDYAEVKAEMGAGAELYTFIYRYFPNTNRIAYKLAENPSLREAFRMTSEFNLPNLKKCIKKYKPDLVISSYFFHTQSLGRWMAEEDLGFKLWTVVADPWTINKVSYVEEADLHLVYDEVGLKAGLGVGIDKEKIVSTGWWVRESMYQKYNSALTRKRWGINDDRPVIFVGGGSLGTSSISKLLPVLLMIKDKVAFVFNTGTDKLAYNMVEEYSKMYKRLNRSDLVKIINLGWVDNMAEVLGACDIVFGKAGPNFLFDTVACEKPFVAITHIGGQEDGNIELIKKKKLGWVKERGFEAGDFLLEYLKNPKKYNKKFEKTIREEALRNKKCWRVMEKKINPTINRA